MPRPRSKSRIEHLAEGHKQLRKAVESFQQVDLRTTRGDLRIAIREARDSASAALTATEAAIKADTPG